MKEEHCYCKYQPLRSEDLLINKEANIWQFLVHWAGCFISKCEEELVHDEKSNSNYFIYGISNIAFCMWQKRRTVRDPDMLGTVFSITGVLMCIISAALGIYTAKLDKLHLQLIENGTKVKGLVEKVYLQKYTRYRRQIPYRILYSFTYHDKVYYHKSRLVWEKPDLKKGDLITVYVNNLGKSTVYNCNKAV